MKFSTTAVVLSVLAIFAPASSTPTPQDALPTPVPVHDVDTSKLERRGISSIEKRYFKGNPVCGASVGGSNGYYLSIQSAYIGLELQPASDTVSAPAGTCVSLNCNHSPTVASSYGGVWFCNDLSTSLSWSANGVGQAAQHIAESCGGDVFYKGVWTNTAGFQVYVGAC
ncbi:hypothetical protein TWF694_004558 [Orbilia ellipsospora]|uniref:Uncharacterized protein n=1 Tax=Orbilia ellipsospora TaxID=2528407 RepID=A0AAV9WVU5_9PEZI